MFKKPVLLAALAFAAPAFAAPALAGSIDPVTDLGIAALTAEKPLAELQAEMRRGELSSESLTRGALALIKAKNPTLHAVISVNREALAAALASDAQRRAGKDLGPLMGIPVLVKDNIETKEALPTTAGSLALKDNVTRRDAPVIARLREAGAIVIGKANLDEWANFRSSHSVDGWSAIGGLTVNPHGKGRSACGSSAGSGAGLAADFAVLAIGTETDGSVVCPASMNGVVGMKPTVGLVSRIHVVPISHSQDTPGPMAHSVTDLAQLLTAMAERHQADFAAGLSADALRGMRVGVLRDRFYANPKPKAVYEAALDRLRGAGAVLVDIPDSKVAALDDAEFLVLLTEFKADLAAYLAEAALAVKVKSLADIIAFNKAHADQELPYFGQEVFEQADLTKGLDDPDYLAARDKAKTLARTKIDGMLKDNDVQILVSPTRGPAILIDTVNGDGEKGPSSAGLPAVAGYPHLSVPMGRVEGLPIGLSFVGPEWSEALLLKAGYAFEQTGH